METIEIQNRLCAKLKELRQQKGLSQEALADELGITRSCYEAWENGRNSVHLSGLIRISRFYGISIDKLLFNEANTPEA